MENEQLPISLTDVEAHIKQLSVILNEKYAKLYAEINNFQKEKANFNELHQILTNFKDPIKLNVGGKIFTTSKATLSKEDSMLKAMFSGRHHIEKGEDGAYFIDRDPKYFRIILNYLRDGECELEGVKKNELLREAEFYCLTSLVNHLKSTDTQLAAENQPLDLQSYIGINACVTEYNAFKLKNTCRYISFKLSDTNEICIERKGDINSITTKIITNFHYEIQISISGNLARCDLSVKIDHAQIKISPR